jgi:hypothetical protein
MAYNALLGAIVFYVPTTVVPGQGPVWPAVVTEVFGGTGATPNVDVTLTVFPPGSAPMHGVSAKYGVRASGKYWEGPA